MQSIAIALKSHDARRRVLIVRAAMQDGNFMSETAQITHQRSSDKAVAADDKDSHDKYLRRIAYTGSVVRRGKGLR